MKNKRSFRLIAFLFLLPAALAAQTAQEYQELGNSFYQKGSYTKAVNYFKKAVQADPKDWQAYENMGNAYMKLNDSTDAKDAYQNSLQINPDNPTLQTLMENIGNTGTNASTSQASSAETAPANSNGDEWEESKPTTVLNSEPGQSEAAPANPNGGEWQESQPATMMARPRGFMRAAKPEPVYNDNLASINHSRGWVDVDLAFNWSNQADLFGSVTNFNSHLAANPGYSGVATAYHEGIEGGAEMGFLLNPNNGIAIGLRGVQTNTYVSNQNLHNGGDFETINVQPTILPLTLDYYVFLPDHDGRFFLTAGVGYYFASAYVDDYYSYNVSQPSVGTDEIQQNVYGGNVGFQVGFGREFQIGRQMALRLFARGRYCKITNLNGNGTDANGNYDNYGLVLLPNGTLAADSTSNIGANGEHYATLDYTGFDAGVGISFF